MPAGWEILEPPSLAATCGGGEGYRRWLRGDCQTRSPSRPLVLAGHSFGAALAVLAAAADEIASRAWRPRSETRRRLGRSACGALRRARAGRARAVRDSRPGARVSRRGRW